MPPGGYNTTFIIILHANLGLSKKSARWVPKQLNQDKEQECVCVSKEFVAAIQHLKYPQNWSDLDPVDLF